MVFDDSDDQYALRPELGDNPPACCAITSVYSFSAKVEQSKTSTNQRPLHPVGSSATPPFVHGFEHDVQVDLT